MVKAQTQAQVIPIKAKGGEGVRTSQQKWSKPVMDLGFSILPSLIFKAQARLALTPTQLVVLMHLADHWWEKNRIPYPAKATLAERMQITPRQVQRHLTALEEKKFIKRIDRFIPHQGQQSNGYDLTGFVEKLKKLEPEFTEVEKQRKRVSKPGGLIANPAAKKIKA